MSLAASSFAIPYFGESEPLFRGLVIRVARSLLMRSREAATGDRAPAPLDRAIERLNGIDAARDLFRPEMSAILEGSAAQSRYGDDESWRYAQGVIAAHLSGLSDDICLEIKTANPLLICGRAVTMPDARLEGDRHRLALLDHGDNVVWNLENQDATGSSPRWADNYATSHLSLPGGEFLLIVPDGWHSVTAFEADIGAPDASTGQQIEETFAFLYQEMPEFYKWTTSVLNHVSPLRRPAANMIASNSALQRWGGVDIAVPATLSETVEMLVHESSHQYFHLLSWSGKLVSPDAKSYYSPLKKTERPLDKILLGYHSFVNVELAFREMLRLGMEREIAERRSTVSRYIQELSKPLQATDELSELGMSVYIPMEEALSSR